MLAVGVWLLLACALGAVLPLIQPAQALPTQARTITLGGGCMGIDPMALAVHPQTGYAYVAHWKGGVSVISGTECLGRLLTDQQRLTAIGINPTTGYVYVPQWIGDRIYVITGTQVVDSVFGTPYRWNGPAAVIAGPGEDMYILTTWRGTAYTNGAGLIRGTEAISHVLTGRQPTAGYLSPATGYLYVTSALSDTVTLISGTTRIADIPVGSHPNAIKGYPATGYVYALNSGEGTVSVISGTQVIAIVTVGAGSTDLGPDPWYGYTFTGSDQAMGVDPTTGYVYVANWADATVSVISGTQVLATLPVGRNPNTILVDPARGYVYVANVGDNTVSVIQGLSVMATLTVGRYPLDMALSPPTGHVYVLNRDDGSLSVIWGEQVLATIPGRPYPQAVAVDSRSGLAYVASAGTNSVSVIIGTQLLATLPVGRNPKAVGVDEATGYVYVANRESDSVTVISGTQVITTLITGQAHPAIGGDYPNDVAVNPATGYVYVTRHPDWGHGGGTVAVLSGTQLIATIPAGGPVAVAANPATGYVYVAEDFSDSLKVISGTTVISRISPLMNLTDVGVNPETGYVYATQSYPERINVISGTQIITTMEVETDPRYVAVIPSTGYVYAADSTDRVYVLRETSLITTLNTAGPHQRAVGTDAVRGYAYVLSSGDTVASVTAISGTTTLASVSAGDDPRAIAVNTATGDVYVANYADASVSFIRATLICGDLTGDGPVDIADIQAVACRWRLSAANPDPDNDPATPNYEARFDLDSDQIISVRDVMLVAAQWGRSCACSPSIEFTRVPPYRSFEDLQGHVWCVNPADFDVAVYIFVSGWWSKPTRAQPLTPINEDSSWTCDITTGGTDQLTTRIAAFLVPRGYEPPLMSGGQTLPTELFEHSVAHVTADREAVYRQIEFSGYTWNVKACETRAGPGPNYFSDDPADVWVDDQGRLHLRIVQRDGRWLQHEGVHHRALGLRHVCVLPGQPGGPTGPQRGTGAVHLGRHRAGAPLPGDGHRVLPLGAGRQRQRPIRGPALVCSRPQVSL